MLGAYANWRLVAGRLRVYTELADDALTLPDYFAARFGEHARLLRVLSASIILLFFTIYAASGIVAGARLFESLFGMPYVPAMLAGALVTIVYTAIGGFLAVSWTDAVQALLMIVALLVAPAVVLVVTGGPGEALDAIARVDPSRLDPFAGAGPVGIASAMAWGLGYAGQPHILARFMAAESLAAIAPARRLGMSWMIACLVGAMLVGLLGIAYAAAHPALGARIDDDPERVFVLLSLDLFPAAIGGLLLAAVLAAIMSTLSAQLIVCSSAITEDFYRAFLRRAASPGELVWVGRLSVLVIAAIAIVLAWDPDQRVLDLVGYAWAGFGAAFGPVVVLSLSWRGATATGALAAMLTGAGVVVAWRLSGGFGVYEMIPGVLAASLALVLGSRLGRPPSAAVLARFDEVHARVRGA